MTTYFRLTSGEAKLLLFLYSLQLKVIKEAERITGLGWHELDDLDEIMRSTSRRIIYAAQIEKTEQRRLDLAAKLPTSDVAQVIDAAQAVDFAQALLVLNMLSDHLVFLDDDRQENDRD